jgi:hypothetical protein
MIQPLTVTQNEWREDHRLNPVLLIFFYEGENAKVMQEDGHT